MKLSFSTNGYVRSSVLEAVERIAKAGYDGVELLADSPHLFPPDVTAPDIAKLKSLLQQTGLSVSNVNANTAVGYYGRTFWEPLFEPSLANPQPTERRWRIEYTKRCIEMAADLGSPNVSITSGRMVPGIDPAESMALFKESLTELLPFAESCGVRLGIEYEPGILIECCEELTALLSETQSVWLGANLDIGHSHVLGEDPKKVISTLGTRIFHVHLEDIRSQKHYHLVPGTGDLDFKEIFDLFAHHGFAGFATVELYTYPHAPDEAAARSLHYLRSILHSGHKENG
jgi:sugar phosphate isomerase/epimerase